MIFPLVTLADEKAHQLIKEQDAREVTKVATEMGVSVKKLDVEAHRHSLRQTLQTFREGDRTHAPQAAQELGHWLEFDSLSHHKHTFKVLREQDLWPQDLQDNLRDFVSKKRELRHEGERALKSEKPSYKTFTYERELSFKEIEQQLKPDMFRLATHLMGEPTSQTRTQLRFGGKGSICVFTEGPKQGLYSNFETGIHGGPLKLIEEHAGLTSAREAKDWAMDWLGGRALVVEHKIIERAPKSHYTWTPLTPVPNEAKGPDIVNDKYLNFYIVKKGFHYVDRYAYRDEEGRLKGYVVRFEKEVVNKDGETETIKQTPPLGYFRSNEKGFTCWRWQGFFEKENRTPYGIEKLAQNRDKPILVVEGEKSCDAAQKLLPEYLVLAWGGGAGSVAKTDWHYLAGKEVVIWPDHDKAGFEAADTLQKIVTSLNAEKALRGQVRVVALPESLTKGWDLADELPKAWSLDTVRAMIQEAPKLERVQPDEQRDVQITAKFMQETVSYLKGMGLEAEVASTRAGYILNEITRIKDLTPVFMKAPQNSEEHPLRIAVVAARLWHEGKQAKHLKVEDPVMTAMTQVKKHDQEQAALVEKAQKWYPHLSQAKIKVLCDYALHHKEVPGKTLDDMQIHQQLYNIAHPSESHNAEAKALEMHHEQTQQLQKTMETLLGQQQQQQMLQRTLQQKRGQELSL